MADDFGIDRLLWPTTPADFITEHFQRRPLVISRSDQTVYEGLLCMRDVEALAFSTSAPENRRWFQLVKDSLPLPMRPPLIDEKGDIRPGQLVSAYYEGYTLVLNQIHKRWPAIGVLCAKVREYFDSSSDVLLKGNVAANVFLTPQRSQGFAAHYHDDEVFVLQIAGAKKWTIYTPLIPDPIEPLGNIPRHRLGDPLQTFQLEAGDFLYIPKGYPHEAAAAGDYSLHLTLNIQTYTWLEAFSLVMGVDQRFRRSLTVAAIDDMQSASEPNHLEQPHSWSASMNDASVTRAVKQLAATRLTDLIILPDDHFEQVNRLDRIDGETVVCKRHGSMCELTRDDRFLILYFPGNRVRYPLQAAGALKTLVSSDKVLVSSLPGLDDAQRVSMIRRLIGEGFLRTWDSGTGES